MYGFEASEGFISDVTDKILSHFQKQSSNAVLYIW